MRTQISQMWIKIVSHSYQNNQKLCVRAQIQFIKKDYIFTSKSKQHYFNSNNINFNIINSSSKTINNILNTQLILIMKLNNKMLWPINNNNNNNIIQMLINKIINNNNISKAINKDTHSNHLLINPDISKITTSSNQIMAIIKGDIRIIIMVIKINVDITIKEIMNIINIINITTDGLIKML